MQRPWLVELFKKFHCFFGLGFVLVSHYYFEAGRTLSDCWEAAEAAIKRSGCIKQTRVIIAGEVPAISLEGVKARRRRDPFEPRGKQAEHLDDSLTVLWIVRIAMLITGKPQPDDPP